MKHTNIYIILFAFLCLLWGLFFLRDWYYFYDMKNLYDTEKYDELTEKYHSNTNAYALHNLWNARYNTWSWELEKLEETLSYYSGALSIWENIKTRYNYEFIKNIIEEIQKQQEEKEEQSEDDKGEEKNETKDENTPSQENSNEAEESNWQESQKQDGEESEKNDTKWQQSSSLQRWEEYKIDTQDAIWKISQEEKDALEQEIENLKREQIYNQKFYGKQPEKAEFRSLFDDFFGDSINRWWEKDW